MLKKQKSWILLLVFCLIGTLVMVFPTNTADAATVIKWSKVKKGSYNSLSPYTLNWTGNVLDQGGFNLTNMEVTSNSNKADFVITQSGYIAANGILKINEELEELTDASISNFKTYENISQGAVYLIILHDGTWAKLKIDTVITSYMNDLSNVTFSYVIEEEIIEDNPQDGNYDYGYKPGQYYEDVAKGLYDDNPFASPELDLLYPGAEYTFEEGVVIITYPAFPEHVAFDIYRSDNGGPYKPVSDFILDEPEFIDYYVFAGHTYLYIFVAYDMYGNATVDLPIKLTVVPVGALGSSTGSSQKQIVMRIDSIIATVDGNTVTLDVAPFIVNGRTLVPIRFISEALGADVGWDGATSTATITLGNKVIALKLNSSEALVDGKKVMMDVPATSINGRTVVPVRFISENFNLDVQFNSETREITITGDAYSSDVGYEAEYDDIGYEDLTFEEMYDYYMDYLVGIWNMWIPSADYKVNGAPGGILIINHDLTWEHNNNNKVTRGDIELYDNGDVILINYMFNWDWYVSPTDDGIIITSPPAAYQVGTPFSLYD